MTHVKKEHQTIISQSALHFFPTEVCHLVVVVGLMLRGAGRFVIWRGAN